MRFSAVLFLALLCTASYALTAQQMPDMPGMQMGPQKSAPQQTTPHAAPKPNRTSQKADPGAPDMKSMGHDAGNRKAQMNAASQSNSVQQQTTQTLAKPGVASDFRSLAVPIQQEQEPEAIGFQTGSDLPAPELLGKIVSLEPLPLTHFLNLADSTNPTLAEAQRDAERSGQQARQVSLPPDPTVGYSGEHIRGGSYHGGEEGAFVSQDFVLGRKLAHRRDIYGAQGRSDALSVEEQRARVHDDVSRAFYHALGMQMDVVMQDRLLKVALDAETNAHELERVGQADAPAVLNAEIAAEQAKLDFENAQRMFLSAYAELATMAGDLHAMPYPLTGDFVQPPQLDAEAVVEQDVQESPAVKQAQAEVNVAEARLKAAKHEAIPDLKVKAGEWYSGEVLGDTNKEAGPMAFAEAGVQLPLWNRNQGNVQAAKVEVERAREYVLQQQLKTRHQAEPFAQQYQTARFSAERYRTEILPRARRAYQLEVTKYQEMAEIYPQVLAAQRMLFSLQRSYLHALDEEWAAAIALQNYTLMGGLEQPMSSGSDDTSLNLPTGKSE